MTMIRYEGLPLEEGAGARVTFLLGENGSGKSHELRRLALHYAEMDRRTIAISNSVFDRFPSRQTSNYSRLSPARGKGYAQRALKQALSSGEDEKRDARSVARMLEYVGFDPEVGVMPVFPRKFDAIAAIEKLRGSDLVSKEDILLIISTIEGVVRREAVGEDRLTWLHLDNGAPLSEIFALTTLIRHEAALAKLKVLSRIVLFLRKDTQILTLDEASSGELCLIATYAFLATRMKYGAVVLVDEPENSLHPRWQSEYCERLLDLFYLYEPCIFLASHSPMIVSGAESKKIPNRIVIMGTSAKKVDSETRSIDGILFEAFGVLSPESHYLSEIVTGLLNDLSVRQTTLQRVIDELTQLSSRSYDAQQKEFLKRAAKLALAVQLESISARSSDES